MDFKCYTSFMRKQKEQKKKKRENEKEMRKKMKKAKIAFIDWFKRGKRINQKIHQQFLCRIEEKNPRYLARLSFNKRDMIFLILKQAKKKKK